MVHRTLALLAVAFTLSVSAAHAQSLQPDFVLTFATPSTRVDVLQFVTKGAFGGPDRVETLAGLTCDSHTLMVRFSTSSTAGIAAAHGAALAAILGFMQGRSEGDIAKIVGPDMPVSFATSYLQLPKGAFESDHVQAVADQLATAVGHISLDATANVISGVVSGEALAFQRASADLGASSRCQ